MRIAAAIPMLIGNMNIRAEKFSATWWAATVVAPKGANNNATSENSVTSNRIVIAMGKPILKVRFMVTMLGLYNCPNKLYFCRAGAKRT